MCVGLCIQVQVVLLSLCALRSSISTCVFKVGMHVNHPGVTGTGNHVGQRINGLFGYAELLLSRKGKKIIQMSPPEDH